MTDDLSQRIHRPDFCHRHRQGAHDFIRKRALDFVTLVVLQIRLMLASLQRELEAHFEAIGYPEGIVTASALSQARRKLRHSAFIELNEHVLRRFYSECPTVKRWRGYVVTAVDGSTLALPRSKELQEAFGGMQPRLGEFRPKARLLERYDVLNHLVWEALMTPYKQGESTVLKTHQQWDQQRLTGLNGREVITLYDRGFAALNLLDWHREQGSPFVLRLPARWWHVARAFVRSGKREEVFTLKVRQRKWSLRLIRVDLPEGEPAVLVTNLMDEKQFPASCFGELYALRWGVESGYKLLKCRGQLEQWSSKHEEGIRQDLHAKVMMLNFTAALSSGSEHQISERSAKQQQKGDIKHRRQLNRTHALGAVRRHVGDLLIQGREKAWQALERLNACFARAMGAVRPNRKAPRKVYPKRVPNQAYKQL